MEKFYQACFNRLGGNDAASGWQLLNVSPSIPQPLKNFYEGSQKSNQPADNQIPKDRFGNDLCTLEILSDGNNIGISRVQYGLLDTFGRDNMFCHGYLFNNAYEMLKDPNSILQISDRNFRFTAEETKDIPETLEQDEPWSEESALRFCGMDKQAYIEYVSCLYYSLSSKAKTTIYVRTDGTTQMARALLYLAYAAIPYCMRSKISASTFGGTTAVTASLILTDALPENCSYIDPRTGENNILTSNLRNRWKRYPFVDYYARYYDALSEKKDLYYGTIEDWLTKMGDPYMQDMDAIRLAFDMMSNNNDSDIAGMLYDWLMLPVPNNEMIEQSLAELLRKAIERNLDLGRDKEELLFQRLEYTKSKDLINLGNLYQAKQLLKMPLDEAVAFINNLKPESRVFNTMRENLSSSSKGLEILCAYYVGNAQAYVSKANMEYEELEDFALTFSDLPQMKAVWEVIAERALQIAVDEIHQGSKYESAAIKLREFFVKNYTEVEWKDCLWAMGEAYDYEFRNHFVPKRADEYIEFYRDMYTGGPEKMDYSLELSKNLDALKNGEWMLVADYALEGCPLNGVSMHPSSEQEKAKQNLMSYALYCGAAKNCLEITFWCKMTKALGIDTVKFMVEENVEVFCDPIEFSSSVMNDPFWTDDNLSIMYKRCKAYIEHTPDNTVKKNLDVLSKEMKNRADAEKKLQKEQKRQERMERHGKEGTLSKFLSFGSAAFVEDDSEPEDNLTTPRFSEEIFKNQKENQTDKLYFNEQTDGLKDTEKQDKGSEKGNLLSSFTKFFEGVGGRGKK